MLKFADKGPLADHARHIRMWEARDLKGHLMFSGNYNNQSAEVLNMQEHYVQMRGFKYKARHKPVKRPDIAECVKAFYAATFAGLSVTC